MSTGDCSPKTRKVWIINIGTELLLGTTVNTNGSWLAERLSSIGYTVERIIIVPDRLEDVAEEVRRAVEKNAGVIITTGGLGPTYDDSTAKYVAIATERELELNREAYGMVEEKYRSLGEPMTPEREKMAYLPRGSFPLRNHLGTAPGFRLCYKNTLVFSLPGVPSEMKLMYEREVEPILKKHTQLTRVERKIQVVGWKESALAPIVNQLARTFPHLYIKSHPKGYEGGSPVIEVQITALSKNTEEGLREIERVRDKLWELMEKEKGNKKGS